MAYSDFTLETAESKLGVRASGGVLFPDLRPVDVPEWLRDVLAEGNKLSLVKEKARSEFIVAPILLAARKLSGGALAIFSGQRLDVDPTRGLTGECDFLLSLSDPIPLPRAPIVAMVEAKKHDIEEALGQCIAEMVAAREFNERAGNGNLVVYGCVTTGEAWQFLRLEGPKVAIDRSRFYLDNLGGILAAFQAIVAECRPAA